MIRRHSILCQSCSTSASFYSSTCVRRYHLSYTTLCITVGCYDRTHLRAPSVHHCMGMVAVYSVTLPTTTRPTVIGRRVLRSHLQLPLLFFFPQCRRYHVARSAYGSRTPTSSNTQKSYKSPFYFETGYALQPKRPSRPFPPPFVSIPSSSFSDPLTTHFQSQDRRPKVKNELIRGLTNGDDAILASEFLLGVNDGVGAWQTKPEGHAAYVSFLPTFVVANLF